MTNTSQILPAFAPARIVRKEISDGGFVLSSPIPLDDYAPNICAFLHDWARATPKRTFLAERDGTGAWRHLSYADAMEKVRAVAGALLGRIRPGTHPVMLLSDNSIEHALIQLAGMYVGIPVAPISPAYSLMSQDHTKLRQIANLLTPRVIFADNGGQYQKALDALDLDQVEVIVKEQPPHRARATTFAKLLSERAFEKVDNAHKAVGPDTLAKILFTSGSSGTPKGVKNTQRMLCVNQEALRCIWPFIQKRPPVLLDWLPWNHTFGGNHNLGLTLRNGGTLYIDNGKPTPDLIERTVLNLDDVSPTIYFNVPRGYSMLLPYLESDATRRNQFFRNLDLIFYSGAALPNDLWLRLEKLSIAARGGALPIVSAWGATETAPAVTCCHFPTNGAGQIGLPLPGTEVKFVPNAGKFELRVRGPQVTPGYYHRDDLTVAAFDADGFYKIGDAGKLADEQHPEKGILFDGRIAEDFKLLTGVWVSTGKIRIAAIDAGAPLIQDVVVTGQDRDEIGLLVFLSPAGLAELSAEGGPDACRIVVDALLTRQLHEAFARFNQTRPGSSERIARILILREPPSIDANEITDKGYINQRAVLERRAALVDVLYSDDPAVIRF